MNFKIVISAKKPFTVNTVTGKGWETCVMGKYSPCVVEYEIKIYENGVVQAHSVWDQIKTKPPSFPRERGQAIELIVYKLDSRFKIKVKTRVDVTKTETCLNVCV